MLFERRLREGIRDGSITVAFRRWKRAQVVAGGRYRTGDDMVEVTSVAVVAAEDITDGDAQRAGYGSALDLVASLRGTPTDPVYRLALVRLDADPRDALAADATLSARDLADISRRLDRLDGASRHGPWTRRTLREIGRRPGERAGDLAQRLGIERQRFKVDVRKLKSLGLTVSLATGYRLSPRGEAYLRSA